MTTRDTDKGFRRILREIEIFKGAKVQVGYFNPELAFIAACNEFGTKWPDGTVHIPERSFLRATFDANVNKYHALAVKYIGRVLDGTLTARGALMLIGARMERDVKKVIRDFDDPPNAPSTIARKGFDDPLIHTRRMLNATAFKVVA